MSEDDRVHVLIADIVKHIDLLRELHNELREAMEKDIGQLGKTKRTAAMVASIVESYYTCAETIFFRISQFFENDLSENRWHKDVLDRMRLEIREYRPCVISDTVFNDLYELLRFRHFKRYYFSLAFDWERLDAIVKRATRVHSRLLENLDTFTDFLYSLSKT